MIIALKKENFNPKRQILSRFQKILKKFKKTFAFIEYMCYNMKLLRAKHADIAQ